MIPSTYICKGIHQQRLLDDDVPALSNSDPALTLLQRIGHVLRAIRAWSPACGVAPVGRAVG